MVPSTTSETRSSIGLRRPLQCAGLALIVTSLAWVGWSLGRAGYTRPKDDRPPQSNNFVVSGISMAPTLRGPWRAASCRECGLNRVVDVAATEIASDRLLCSHCGVPLKLERQHGGDVVEVQAFDLPIAIQRGELVAAKNEDSNQPFVKRVIGLPGGHH